MGDLVVGVLIPLRLFSQLIIKKLSFIFKLPPLLTETHMEPVVSYEHDDGAVSQTAVLQGSQGPAHLENISSLWSSRPMRAQ